MKKSFVLLINLGFWLCYGVLIIILLMVYNRSTPHGADHVVRMVNALKNLLLFAVIPSVVCYFSYYFLLFPRYLQQKKFLLGIVFGVLIAVGISVPVYLLHRYLIESGHVIDMDEGGKNGRSTAITVIGVMTGIGLVFGVVALLIRGFITWFDEIK